MSMLSSQINELRNKARLFEGYQNGDISFMMREAADTIENLRDRLQADGETCEIETDSEELEVIVCSPEDTWGYRCSACGWTFRYERGIKPRFCPNCRREVVDA